MHESAKKKKILLSATYTSFWLWHYSCTDAKDGGALPLWKPINQNGRTDIHESVKDYDRQRSGIEIH
jgi:hypothetical protein